MDNPIHFQNLFIFSYKPIDIVGLKVYIIINIKISIFEIYVKEGILLWQRNLIQREV